MAWCTSCATGIVHDLSANGALVFSRLAENLPGLVVLHPEKGLFAVDISLASTESEFETDKTSLKRKTRALTRELEDISLLGRPSFAIVRCPHSQASGQSQIAVDDFLAGFPAKEVPEAAFRSVSRRLNPVMTFEVEQRMPFSDVHHDERRKARIHLDDLQSEIAVMETRGVIWVHGPAGSGKTLILRARARYLAQQNPDWNILFLCYNRVLEINLKELLKDTPNVQVLSFSHWASLERSHTPEAIRSRSIDALLIDEVQDFDARWLHQLLPQVRGGRGGAMVAGDSNQALYRDLDLRGAVNGTSLVEIKLEKPYRSTRQILEVIECLDPNLAVNGKELAPDGEPVELIYAQTLQQKVDCIARIVHEQVQNGRSLDEIAVLCTNNFEQRGIASGLYGHDFAVNSIHSKNSPDFRLSWLPERLNLMTMHSAKGLERPVVILVGLEGLGRDAGRAGDFAPEDVERFARLNLVGPSRASDLLFITYSRDNVYIQRLIESQAPVKKRIWPDDFAEVVNSG